MTDQIIVQKYGGSSLKSPAHIRRIAERIAVRARRDRRIVVTVSAMGQSTDELLRLATEVTPQPPQRELDMLLTAGERVSMALLSMALNSIGCNAISFTGSQGGIVTNVSHTRALIEEIRADRIEKELQLGKVVIVAGFQGVSRAREVTTLGRGGSDTTAVALAAILGAHRCEIYSDYPGVFTADPRVTGSARPIPRLDYETMLELAVLGARVLHYRAAEIARRYRVPLWLLSSFDDSGGTFVGDDIMETPRATSVTCLPSVRVLRVSGPPDSPDAAALSLRLGASELQIVHYSKRSEDGRTEISVIVPAEDAAALDRFVSQATGGSLEISVTTTMATVSVVGSGSAGNTSIASRAEDALGDAGIPVSLVTTTACGVTCLIRADRCDEAVRVLHREFVEAAGV